MNLVSQIEAVLFFKGEPISVNKLALLLNAKKEDVLESIKELEKTLENRGIVLMRNGDDVMLGTSSSNSALIEKITKDELVKDIGRAGLETLSIILYRGPISRWEIDYIRGVNSNFILRNLLIRGLVERVDSEEGERSFSYRPTFELLSYLGVSKIEDLPDYMSTIASLEQFSKEEVVKSE